MPQTLGVRENLAKQDVRLLLPSGTELKIIIKCTISDFNDYFRKFMKLCRCVFEFQIGAEKNQTTIFKRPSKAIRNMNEQFGFKKKSYEKEWVRKGERERERERVFSEARKWVEVSVYRFFNSSKVNLFDLHVWKLIDLLGFHPLQT